jgi:hypothetical protein
LKRYFLWISEALVILTVLLVINNYLGNQELLIKADGKGYYDYLPATFIYGDLNFNYTDTLQTDYYDQKSYSSGYLKQVNGKQINKYFPGVSFLWAPFFLTSHLYALNSEHPADGYSSPYQKSIFFAAIFYLWLGLLYLRKLLQEFNIDPINIFIIQLLFALATPLLNYVQYDPSFTHTYSFSLITIFSFYSFKYVRNQKPKHLFISALLLGLITIIRPINLMSGGIVFIFFSSFEELKNTFKYIFQRQLFQLGIALLVFLITISIVPILWWYQTNHFFIWGYQNEGFNFLSPAFFNFLFSFRKGAMLHTPLLFFSTIGGVYTWVKCKSYYKAFVFTLFLVLITYILSSWWSWYYGASYGSRPMIDYYVIFGLALGISLHQLKNKISRTIISILLIGIFIPVNIIQVFQYQNYIMDWEEMTWSKFKFIGLHTEKKYRGVFFRKTIDYSANEILFSKEFHLESPIHFLPEKNDWISTFIIDSIVNINDANYVHIIADIEYKNGTSEIILSINDSTQKNIYSYSPHVFASTKMENTRTTANFYYQIPSIPPKSTFLIGVSSHTDEIIVHQAEIILIHKP